VTSFQQLLVRILLAGTGCGTVCTAAVAGEPGTNSKSEVGALENQIAPGVWTSDDGARVIYDASFFAPYQIVNAADMLRWVPGGSALLPDSSRRGNNDQEKRGFGSSGDQVLINGKRISGKSNDISSAMQRIQSSLVSRIEVIRGTSAGLDVRSEGTLINVVLTEESSGGSGSWQLHSGFYGDSPEYDGLVSYSNARGKLNYLLSAELGPYNRGSNEQQYEQYFRPDESSPYELRDIEKPELKQELVLNASGSWDFDNGDTLNLNTRVADKGEDQDETTFVTVVGDPATENLLNQKTEDGLDWEVGGILENQVGPAGSLKTRLIYSSKETMNRSLCHWPRQFPATCHPNRSWKPTSWKPKQSSVPAIAGR